MNLQSTNKFAFFTEKHRKLVTFLCYLVPFAVLGGYLVSIILRGLTIPATGYYLIQYLYTYDHGFVARGFVGEAISWFFDTVSDKLTEQVSTLFAVLLTVALSLCIGKALSKTKDKPEHFFIVAVLSILICICPVGFPHYCIDDRMDKLTWALALFGVFLAGKKYAIWLVPALCVLATLVNPVFLFTSMILTSIILLYNFYTSNFSLKNGIVCAVSYISMIALGLYSLISEKKLGFESPNEMVDFYFSRYDGTISETLYNTFVNGWLVDYFEDAAGIIEFCHQLYFSDNGSAFVIDLIFLMIPTYTLTSLFWKSCIKVSDNKFHRFIFFLCAISPVVYFPIVFLILQSSKYFYNNLFVQMALMIFFVSQNDCAVTDTFKKAFEWIKNHLIISVCAAIYFLSVVIL